MPLVKGNLLFKILNLNYMNLNYRGDLSFAHLNLSKLTFFLPQLSQHKTK